MTVLIVSTSDVSGGASVAAVRLTEALNNNGVEAQMLVRERLTELFGDVCARIPRPENRFRLVPIGAGLIDRNFHVALIARDDVARNLGGNFVIDSESSRQKLNEFVRRL